MTLLNTSFHLDSVFRDEFLSWINDVYKPAILSSGNFSDFLFARILEEVGQGVDAYCFQCRSVSESEAKDWRDNEGGKLMSSFARRFPERVVYFTTLMEIL